MPLALVNVPATKIVVIKNSNPLLLPDSYILTRFARYFKCIQKNLSDFILLSMVFMKDLPAYLNLKA